MVEHFGIEPKMMCGVFSSILLALILFQKANATLYLNLVRPVSAGVENNLHHLHIREIEAYSINGRKLSLIVDSFDSELDSDPISNTIDGDYSTVGHTYYPENTAIDHFFKYEISSFDDVCLLGYIKIYNRDDSWSKRMVGSYLEIINNSNSLFRFNLTTDKNLYYLSLNQIDKYKTMCSVAG